ncbi:MAG: DUF4236 domain-containing protein [Syntrophobacteraceae bacterium]|nr:DUF4236 domain-containing protein [Syntrophobacteraceae bacterium]
MGFRFWRRVSILPGVTLNLSKSGGSLSFGPRGAKFTVGPRGKRVTVGLPGTGLFYTTTLGGADSPVHKSGGSQSRAAGVPGARLPGGKLEPPPLVRSKDRLTMGFFKRLITPDDEEALVDGCRALVEGSEDAALEHLRRAVHLADGAYLAGFLALGKNRLDEAAACLEAACRNYEELGRHFERYGISAVISLSITDEISAHVSPVLRGVLLGLAEVCQLQGRFDDAERRLRQLLALDPEDRVVKLSLAEILLDDPARGQDAWREVVKLAEGVENESAVHAGLMLMRGRALLRLGMPEAARQVLAAALRRTKDRPVELLRALRYELALACEAAGQPARARREWEKIFSEDPDYEDVALRIQG